MPMIRVASRRLNSSHAPLMTKAGMVKMAPATNDSPTDAVVRAIFSSRMLPRKMRRTAIATTAAGKVAATVRPTFMPRYALAAPSTTAITTPRNNALNVSSGMVVSAGT